MKKRKAHIKMKDMDSLNELELTLRGIIYAAETRNDPYPNGVIMSQAFLDHRIQEAKEVCINNGIPLCPLPKSMEP